MAKIIPFLYGYWKKDNDQGEGNSTVENQSKNTKNRADPNFIGVNTVRRLSLRL